MPEEAMAREKTYHEWLEEALRRDETTWTALEEKLSRLRGKREEAPASATAPREA